MTSFIIIVVITLFIVAIGFTWFRLEAYDGLEKVIICVVGILISWGITATVYLISSAGIDYFSTEAKNEISKILILVFTPINLTVIMPFIGKIMSQLKFEEIDTKDAIRKVAIFLVIVFAILFVETQYLENVQLGILNIAK